MPSADIASILSRLTYTTKPYVTQGVFLGERMIVKAYLNTFVEMWSASDEPIKPEEYLQNGKLSYSPTP